VARLVLCKNSIKLDLANQTDPKIGFSRNRAYKLSWIILRSLAQQSPRIFLKITKL
jgi:hypothetical protein